MRQLWLNWVLKYPWWVLLGNLLLVILMSAGLSKLYFRGDYRIFFAADNPQLVAFEQMQDEFNKSDNMLLAIASKDGTVFTASTLTLIKQLTDEAWQTPHSIRVDSITNFQHTEADNDDLIVEDLLLDASMLNTDKIAKVRQVALNEPTLVHRLISPNASVTAINITVQLPEVDKNKEVFDVYNFVQQLKQNAEAAHPELDFYLGGVIALNQAFASEAEHDARTLVPLMFGIIILLLAVLLRSVFGALATVIIIIFTITSTLGIAGWSGIFLSTATVNVPTFVMTLAVADCVHVIASMQFALNRGDSKTDAIRYSMQRNIMPVFITSATTAIGFLTLNFSDVPILADLGNLTAVGVMLACWLSIAALPALLNILPIKARANTQSGTDTAMDKIADFVIKRHKILLPAMTLLMLVFAGFISLNKVNDEAVKYFATSTEFRQ
ncbi:MAG TPA: MMPL family transporter, partial [Rheinheimera sp.]|nr:MMPL family transporter [Rheinheimera sp.]